MYSKGSSAFRLFIHSNKSVKSSSITKERFVISHNSSTFKNSIKKSCASLDGRGTLPSNNPPIVTKRSLTIYLLRIYPLMQSHLYLQHPFQALLTSRQQADVCNKKIYILDVKVESFYFPLQVF